MALFAPEAKRLFAEITASRAVHTGNTSTVVAATRMTRAFVLCTQVTLYLPGKVMNSHALTVGPLQAILTRFIVDISFHCFLFFEKSTGQK
jgi:hypothetical protein